MYCRVARRNLRLSLYPGVNVEPREDLNVPDLLFDFVSCHNYLNPLSVLIQGRVCKYIVRQIHFGINAQELRFLWCQNAWTGHYDFTNPHRIRVKLPSPDGFKEYRSLESLILNVWTHMLPGIFTHHTAAAPLQCAKSFGIPC